MKYFLGLLLVLVLLVFSCKKETKEFEISGNIISQQKQLPMSGAKVYLDAKKIVNGVYNSSFVNITSTTTNSDGTFDMSVKDDKVSEYRFRASESGYSDFEEIVAVDKLEASGTFSMNIKLTQESWIKLNVKNTMPQGVDDKITYRFTNINVKGKDCCNNDPIEGNGYDYSVQHNCRAQSHAWIYLDWTVSKNGGQVLHDDSIWTGDGITVTYNLNY